MVLHFSFQATEYTRLLHPSRRQLLEQSLQGQAIGFIAVEDEV